MPFSSLGGCTLYSISGQVRWVGGWLIGVYELYSAVNMTAGLAMNNGSNMHVYTAL